MEITMSITNVEKFSTIYTQSYAKQQINCNPGVQYAAM